MLNRLYRVLFILCIDTLAAIASPHYIIFTLCAVTCFTRVFCLSTRKSLDYRPSNLLLGMCLKGRKEIGCTTHSHILTYITRIVFGWFKWYNQFRWIFLSHISFPFVLETGSCHAYKIHRKHYCVRQRLTQSIGE